MSVFRLTQRQGVTQARLRQSSRALGADIGQLTFGYAYCRVLSDHPEVQTLVERHELALQLAQDLLHEASKYLSDEVPRIDDCKQA